MNNNTRIKLYRKIDDWGWRGKPNTFSLFVYLLCNANIKEKEYQGFKINKGDCVIGRKILSKRLGMTEQELRTSIKHLKSTSEITIKSTNKFSIITVCKWELYQPDKKKQPAHQPAHQQTSNQQLTTPKECNNIINNTEKGKEKIVELIGNENAVRYKGALSCLWKLIQYGYQIEATDKSIMEFIEWLKEKANIYSYKSPIGTIDYGGMLKKFDRWYERHKEKKDTVQNYKSSVLKFLDPSKPIKGVKK